MKKAGAILMGVLYFFLLLLPVGKLSAGLLGYSFLLTNAPVASGLTAMVAIAAVVCSLPGFPGEQGPWVRRVCVWSLPVALVNSLFYLVLYRNAWVVPGLLICDGCCIALAFMHKGMRLSKAAAAVLSAVPVMLLCPLLFLTLFFNLRSDTVTQTLYSPSGRRYAQVISSDQGALGGDTVVYVRERAKLNALLFTVEKNPVAVYLGAWYEHENMVIAWEGEDVLTVNGQSCFCDGTKAP